MTEEFYKHVEDNSPTFDVWIENHSKLQHSMDILQPLIEPFLKENPIVNLKGCPECLTDMLIWAKIQLKNKEGKLVKVKK